MRVAVRSVWRRSPTLQGRVASLALLLVIAGGVAVYWNHFRATVPCSDGVHYPPFGATANWPGPHGSLERKLEIYDVVIVGEYLGVSGVDVIYPERYDPNELDLPKGIDLGVPIGKLAVRADQYLVGEGPDLLAVSHFGDVRTGEVPREAPVPSFGRPMLLFLIEEPHLNSWGGPPWARQCEIGGSMFHAWGGAGEPVEVSYFAGMTLEEAADEVRRVASEMGR